MRTVCVIILLADRDWCGVVNSIFSNQLKAMDCVFFNVEMLIIIYCHCRQRSTELCFQLVLECFCSSTLYVVTLTVFAKLCCFLSSFTGCQSIGLTLFPFLQELWSEHWPDRLLVCTVPAEGTGLLECTCVICDSQILLHGGLRRDQKWGDFRSKVKQIKWIDRWISS